MTLPREDILVIIPARGGSKGIPRKNIKPLAGRPLIDYSIRAALQLTVPERVILSTDDEEIAATARSLGLPVEYMRPPELATDTAGSREMMLHAMEWAAARGTAFSRVVLLQPTSPMRTAADVECALRLYDEATPEPDMVVSVCESAANPYYDCFETEPDGTLHVSKGDGAFTRRQDAPKAWQLNGAVYVINPASLRAMPMGAFRRRIPMEMPRERSVDLDTPLDWALAEMLMTAPANPPVTH